MKVFTNEFTGERLLLDPTEVWHEARIDRLLGRRHATIYMHYRAWLKASEEFIITCKLRDIEIKVVH